MVGVHAAYEHGHNWLEQLIHYLDDNFSYLAEFLATHLPKAIFKTPEATYLAWVDIGAYCEKEANLTEFFAKKAGVLLEGGNMFVNNAQGCIRLNLACPRSKLIKGLDKIAQALVGVDAD